MRKAPVRPSRPESPKDIARDIAERDPVDHVKIKRESRRAVKAADRLLKEMDDFMKSHAPKR